ncbi:unnamed protein product [Soboliphyme baturini]|uniref:Heat shock protein n=1 Tax=Soboliphyme baturini TaxID=241478 RepID=A0A183IQ80_9BILA|nr:unnamed protein product [Soboliphyme baturini]
MDKADAKNAVEEYVYDLRNRLSNELEKFIKKQDCTEFVNLLNSTETWLYDEGDDLSKEVYQEKLRQLKNIGDPVIERYREYTERPAAFQRLNEMLNTAKNAFSAYMSKNEKYSHWEPSDAEKLRKAIDEKERWYQQQMAAQSRRALTEPPAVFVHQIVLEAQMFESVVGPILNKPKPTPKKKKESAPNEKKESAKEASPESKAPTAGEQQVPSEPVPKVEEVD